MSSLLSVVYDITRHVNSHILSGFTSLVLAPTVSWIFLGMDRPIFLNPLLVTTGQFPISIQTQCFSYSNIWLNNYTQNHYSKMEEIES